MKLWSLILMFICLNTAGIIIGILYSQGVIIATESQAMPYSPEDISGRFNVLKFFSIQNVVYGLTGGVIGAIFGVITGSGVFAVGALLIFVVISLVPIVSWTLTGFGVMMNIFFAGTGLEFLSYIIYAVLLVFFFLYLTSILAQRSDMT